MIPFFLVPALLIAGASAVPVTEQRPLGNELQGIQDSSTAPSRGLSGRFLHITDLHPDSYYKAGTSIANSACHRGKGDAGYYGAAGTDCDSPFTLIDETFRWIENNLKDEIDFVVWTGDSARHDNDERIPRTKDEVLRLNEILVEKFVDVFKREDSTHVTNAGRALSVPIVPTIGNNDVMPHNIMKSGPNRWTKRFLEIWNDFIPEEQRHTFVEGGWFTAEVIPHKLAVVSLNTMYFYDSNNAVDGCNDKSEPGYEHMEWLRVQLKLLRERDMKAILVGHVPPARSGSKRNWDETCWQKYTLWLHQYRDVIVGSMYGHMNIDHFMLQDSRKVKIADFETSETLSNTTTKRPSGQISAQSRSDYLSSLRKQWSRLPSPPADLSIDFDSTEDWIAEYLDEVEVDPRDTQASKKKEKKRFWKKIGGPWAERYSVSLVSPSVVPNYFPTLRVIEYNISGLEDTITWAEADSDHGLRLEESPGSEEDNGQTYSPGEDVEKKKKKNKGKKKKKKPHFEVPEPPSPSAPPGPAYSNQPLTWLSYSQYFANLTKIHEEAALQDLQQGPSLDNNTLDELGKPNKPTHDYFSYELEYDTRHDGVYQMKDLTVRSFFNLASRIAKTNPSAKDLLFSPDDALDSSINSVTGSEYGNIDTSKKKKKKHKKPKNRTWKVFLRRAFVGFLDDDELDDLLVQ